MSHLINRPLRSKPQNSCRSASSLAPVLASMVDATARQCYSPPILSAFALKHLDNCSVHERCQVFVLPLFCSRLLPSTSTLKHSIHPCFFLLSALDLKKGKAMQFAAGEREYSSGWGSRERVYDYCRYQMTRQRCRVPFSLNTGGGGSLDTGDGRGSLDGDNAGFGRTRLGEIASAAAQEVLKKLNSARKNFPTKIFLLLLGFYTANALATILGQTGDWDVLVAGVVVAAIEAIGMLMYRKPSSIMMGGRLRALTVFINYWKAGVCLGLFVDAFKLGS